MPPLTTRYRFYVSCDDDCTVDLGNSPNNDTDLTRILNIYHSTSRRNYWKTTDGLSRISEWVNLTADEAYFLEVKHFQWTNNNDHVTVGVEIE
mmetsp:Transcript_41642/g.63597  ORF Transcript_41642/g.63597 Transcript_41642/m.63597 type:complete len:93 (+) Transcript_41642:513-791(+)